MNIEPDSRNWPFSGVGVWEKVSGASMFDTLFLGATVNADHEIAPDAAQRSVDFFSFSNYHPDLPRSMWQSPLYDGCCFDVEEVYADVFGKTRVVREWLNNPGVVLRFEMGNRVYGERSLRSMFRVVERDQWGRTRIRVSTDNARWLKGLRIQPKAYFRMRLQWPTPPREILRAGVEMHGMMWRRLT